MANKIPETYTFSFVIDNFLTLYTGGGGSYIFGANDYNIPSTYVLPGMPDNLTNLIALVPSQYLSLTFAFSGTGNLGGFDCDRQYTLYANVSFYNGERVENTLITQSSPNSNRGGYIDTGFITIPHTGSSALYQVTFYAACSGSGCGCVPAYIWGDIKMSMKVTVSIAMINYCTETGTENIYGDFCYNYIASYMVQNQKSSSPSMQGIATYLNEYCTTKYVNKGLSLFNSPNDIDNKDYNICACNMDKGDYMTFLQSVENQIHVSLGSIAGQCLLPACKESSFQPGYLDGCPVPQCLNIVNINESNIAGPVSINESADCTQYDISNTIGAPPVSESYIPPAPAPQKTIESNAKIIVIVVVVVIVVIVIVIILVLVLHKKK